jgi:hypothetical protein
MGMLAFFPWMHIRGEVSVEEFELVPFERALLPAGEATPEQLAYDSLLAPYHSGRDPICRATLVKFKAADLVQDLPEGERTSLFALAEIIATSGLAARRFFDGIFPYCNRDNFRLYIQGFQRDVDGFVVTSRRRDGDTTQVWSSDYFRVQKPEHVDLREPMPTPLDRGLLTALLGSREIGEWEAFYEAILGFNFANTDSPEIPQQTEAVLLAGAFERLYKCDHGRENDLVDRFSTAFAPAEEMPVTALPRCAGRFKKASSMREMWIRDFFRLRGNLAHGRAQSQYQSCWGLRDHLLFGSFVFPLALKTELLRVGKYSLTDDDHLQIEMFEELLCHDHFREPSEPGGREYPWTGVVQEFRKRRRIARTIERWQESQSRKSGSSK